VHNKKKKAEGALNYEASNACSERYYESLVEATERTERTEKAASYEGKLERARLTSREQSGKRKEKAAAEIVEVINFDPAYVAFKGKADEGEIDERSECEN